MNPLNFTLMIGGAFAVRDEYKEPNILEYIEMMMEEGYSEDDAARMWFCLYADSWDDDE